MHDPETRPAPPAEEDSQETPGQDAAEDTAPDDPEPINPVEIFGTERSPDFFCIGTEKAGTTWLWHCLNAHPHVGVPATKELRYFNEERMADFRHFRALQHLLEDPGSVPMRPQFMERIATELRLFYGGQSAYLRIFGQLAQPVVGELSPQYCLIPPEQVSRMHALAPEARILYMLRDPVDRIVSGARMVLRAQDVPFTDEAILEAALNPKQVALCNAPVHLDKYEEVFGKPQVAVFFFDDIATRPAELLQEICEFLGVRRADVPRDVLCHVANAGAVYAPGPEVISPLFEKLGPIYDRLETRFPQRVAAWRARHTR